MWWVSFCSLFLMSSLWAVGQPAFTGFDEVSQFARVASVARLQLFPTSNPVGEGRFFEVELPEQYATVWVSNACMNFNPDAPSGCVPPLQADDGPVRRTFTPYGNYPPLYYTLVSLPTLVLPVAKGVWAVRLLGAAICSACVASALAAAWSHRRRALTLSMAVVLTPSVVSLHALVNPNGLEVAGAILTWTAGLVLISTESRCRRDYWRLALGVVVLGSARPTSLLWVGCVAAVLALWAGWRRSWELVRSDAARRPLIVMGVVALLDAAWVYQAHYGETTAWTSLYALPGQSGSWYLREAFERTGTHLVEMVARFGYLDVGAPWFVYVAWALALGALVVGVVVARDRRGLLALGVLVGLVLVAPPVLEAAEIATINFWWQGRYALPLAVGLPLLAGATLDRRGKQAAASRGTLVVFPVLGVASLSAFYWMLHRFTVGDAAAAWTLTDAPVSPVLSPGSPRFGPWLLLGLVGVSTAVSLAWIARLGCFESRTQNAQLSARSQAVLDALGARVLAPPRQPVSTTGERRRALRGSSATTRVSSADELGPT